MSELDDAVQAMDDLKGRLDAIAGLGDLATQLNAFKDQLGAVGNLQDTAQKIKDVQENLKLEDKLKEVYTKLKNLTEEFPKEKWEAFFTALLTLLEVGKGVYELYSIGTTMSDLNKEVTESNEEAQTTFQAMDGLNTNLQTISQLDTLAGQITDLKGKLDAVSNLGDVASQLGDLKEKLDAAEEKLKAASAAAG